MLTGLRNLKMAGPPGPARGEDARLVLGALGIPTYRQALPVLRAELRRARRYQHPLSAVALSTVGGVAAAPPEELPWAAQLPFYLLGSLLHDVLRETDVPVYAAEHHVFAVLLVETQARDAALAVRRLRELFRGRARMDLRAGLAAFPHDAFTVEDLFAHAFRAWEERPLGEAADPHPLQEVRDA